MSLYVIALLVVTLIALLLIFHAISVVCDEHLVPTVEVFIRQYRVPEEIAAVTLIAIGNATPELLLNTVSGIVYTPSAPVGEEPPIEHASMTSLRHVLDNVYHVTLMY